MNLPFMHENDNVIIQRNKILNYVDFDWNSIQFNSMQAKSEEHVLFRNQ